jgi:type I restriction enzyme S subunit
VVDIRETDRKFVSGGSALLNGKYSLLGGDILLVRGNGNIRLVGKAGLVLRDMDGILYPDLLMRIRTSNRILPKFLTLNLNCPVVSEQVESAARTAVGTFKINNQQVKQLWIPLPGIEEQKAILQYVISNTSSIDEVIVRTEKEVFLLTEYRTRLVADVVTGKLDVREAAAKLPVEEHAIEPGELVEDDSEMIEDEITEPAG